MLGISHARRLRKKMEAFQDVLDADNDWEAGSCLGGCLDVRARDDVHRVGWFAI